MRVSNVGVVNVPRPAAPRAAAPAAPAKTANAATDRFVRPPTNLLFFADYVQNQGFTSACGTTCAAMLISFWKGKPNAVTHGELDRSIRPYFKVGTSPQNVVSYLNQHGFRAAGYNRASYEDLKKVLDLGVPVQVLIDADGDGRNASTHYVNVVGYDADASGKVRGVHVADPGHGSLTWMPVADFEKRWGHVRQLGMKSGAHHLMIVALPKEATQVRGKDGKVRSSSDLSLPPNGGNWGLGVGFLDVLSDTANFFGRLAQRVLP